MLPTSSLQAVFLFSFLAAIGAVVSPGPVSAAIVSQAPRRGWLAGPLVATGHSILELVIVLLIAFGLSAGLANPAIQVWIALLGGLLLVWMGGKMAWDAWKGYLRLPGPEGERVRLSTRQLVGLGMVATISNPFWYAWWVTVAAGYLSQARALGMAAVLAFYIGHISADYAWDTVLSTVVGGGRRWLNDRLYRGLILVCGGFLVYLGLVFLWRGITLSPFVG
jgi:threonine/homoserine/homoserine lactone efflux protein